MLYELQWALNEEGFSDEQSFIQVSESKFMDLQLVPGDFNPADYDSLLARKKTIFSLSKHVIKAKVITLTLGLIEVWYDNKTERHLNMVPDIKTAIKEKGRFELRLLNVDENVANLESIHRLISRYTKDFKMIVTVSPVPLHTTFTKNDIIIANTHSKSTLVCAAHTFVENHENTDYFPSYEIALLSQKEKLWEDDLRHVSESGANLIIDTFLKAYMNP